jgi:hypothetical protein
LNFKSHSVAIKNFYRKHFKASFDHHNKTKSWKKAEIVRSQLHDWVRRYERNHKLEVYNPFIDEEQKAMIIQKAINLGNQYKKAIR